MTRKEIPFFNYPFLYEEDKEKYKEIFDDIGSRGAFVLQKDLFQFEEDLAKFINVKHAIGMADGTNSLMVALMAAGIGQGDEVIVPSHTFIASVGAIHFSGATPVLVEAGADHLIDPKSTEAAITSKTKAIMPVQLNGRTANMDPIVKLAKKHNLQIIEDSAQALGSSYKGKYAGTFGLAGSFSFYPAKSLGCFGDGGALVTNDDDFATKVRLMRDHGRNGTDVDIWGTNSRLDNMQAAFLIHKLKKFPQAIKKRRELASMYNEGLSGIEDLTLPPAPGSDENHFDTFQNYELESGRRDELEEHLTKNGIKTIRQWGGKAIHQFKKLNFDVKLPYTEQLMDRMLMIPMNTSLQDDDIAYIVDTIRGFYK